MAGACRFLVDDDFFVLSPSPLKAVKPEAGFPGNVFHRWRFFNITPELPDMGTQNRPKVYQKGKRSDFFGENLTSGNSEVAFLVGVFPSFLVLLTRTFEKGEILGLSKFKYENKYPDRSIRIQ